MTSGWIHEYAFSIHSPPERIFTALTSAAELEQWFAEHAEVEPTPGGAFRFWGRHTVGRPRKQDATGKVVASEPDRHLAFTWPLFGVPTTVTITLTPEETKKGPATKVAVQHALEAMIDQPRPKEMVEDWWRFALGNLRAHTTGRGQVMRPDFADPSPEVRVSMTVDAPPATVFRALIEPDALNQWLAKDATVEPRVGGRFDLGWKQDSDLEHEGAAMQILEFVPNEKLTISWPDWRGDASVPAQSVTWLLAAEGDGTRVTLIHAGFTRAVDMSDYPFGWWGFLSRLARVAKSLED